MRGDTQLWSDAYGKGRHVSAPTWYVGLPDEKISRGTQSSSSNPKNSRVPCTYTQHQTTAVLIVQNCL